jgi:hypothetical protein
MRSEKLRSCCLGVILLFGMQSLADLALKEAERRKQMDSQGVQAKVIEGNGGSTVPTFPEPTPRTEKASQDSKKKPASIEYYRNALRKLDKAIRQDEIHLESLRTRLQSEKWATPKIGRTSKIDSAAENREKLQEQIEELQQKIKLAHEEREDIYQSGKKDGYLPGELEGKGIIP